MTFDAHATFTLPISEYSTFIIGYSQIRATNSAVHFKIHKCRIIGY